MFKRGDLVRCIDNKAAGERLTLNKDYVVLESQAREDSWVHVSDDKGAITDWYPHRFELIETPQDAPVEIPTPELPASLSIDEDITNLFMLKALADKYGFALEKK